MREKNYNTGLRGVLFEATHCKKMGQAVWLYGWLVLRETRERDGIGFVLGGRPVSYREIEDETGFARKSLERWMRILRRNGYIETTTAQSGLIVRIEKAKKFLRPTPQTDRKGFPQQQGKAVQKLWKSPAAHSKPPSDLRTPHLRCEAGAPHFCAAVGVKSEENEPFTQGIGSREIETQIEIQQKTFHPARAAVENATAFLSSESFFQLGKPKSAGGREGGLPKKERELSRLHAAAPRKFQ